jgi:hypothetical protein
MTTRRGSFRALAATVVQLTTPSARRFGFSDAALLGAWAGLVGDRLAAATLPERITYPLRRRSDGTLRLRVANGGLALELQHLQRELIDRINTHIGYPAIGRLHLVQGPIPRPRRRAGAAPRPLDAGEEEALGASVAQICDDDVRAALTALGRAVLGRANRS